MKTKEFTMTTLNGMVYGLFATLIIGVIVQQFGALLNIEIIEVTLANTLKGLMGVGIGMGIALSLKMNGLKMVVASIMGGIATSFKVQLAFGVQPEIILGTNNDPVTTYFVVVVGILFLQKVLIKRTPIDILLIPLLGTIIAFILTLGFSGPIGLGLDYISIGIERATLYAPFPMSIIIAVVMGMLLTAPISSAAIAIAINLDGIAGGAAVVGTTVQMIGFAIQSRKDNNLGMVLSIAFGTSMLQFKNILKKPMIWLPTIIASAIISPIIVLTLNTETSMFGAGMGSSGLVGQLQTLYEMNYSLNAWISIALMIGLAALLVFVIDLLFRKYNLIVDGDLKVGNDIT